MRKNAGEKVNEVAHARTHAREHRKVKKQERRCSFINHEFKARENPEGSFIKR